jgi:hypothetical protein
MPSQFVPYFIATPLVTLVFALYGKVMPFGLLGYLAGAVGGFAWSLLGGLVAGWLDRDASNALLSANVSVFGCIRPPDCWSGAFCTY